ncbi:MAG: hypothetical protein KDK70_15915 [Myxococcales bacterium]|nr:hypothetical protein [Myxococcales bacterium]
MSDRSAARPRRIPVRCQGPSQLARGRRPAAPPPGWELPPLPATETHAWSRSLWGCFLPERRRRPRPAPPTDAAA